MGKKSIVRQGYDLLGDQYATARDGNQAELELIEAFLRSVGTDGLVLDAGCGPGHPILTTLSERHHTIGLDFSRSQLDIAATNARTAHLIQGDMVEVPVRSNAVDGITAFHSLIHIPYDEHQSVIDEFARILTPGGHLLLCEGPGDWSGTNEDWLESGVEMTWDIAGPDATRQQLRTSGFSISKEQEISSDFDGDGSWIYYHAIIENQEVVTG